MAVKTLEDVKSKVNSFLLAFKVEGSVAVEKNSKGESGDVLCVVQGTLAQETIEFLGREVKGVAVCEEQNVSVLRFRGPSKPRKTKPATNGNKPAKK